MNLYSRISDFFSIVSIRNSPTARLAKHQNYLEKIFLHSYDDKVEIPPSKLVRKQADFVMVQSKVVHYFRLRTRKKQSKLDLLMGLLHLKFRFQHGNHGLDGAWFIVILRLPILDENDDLIFIGQ